VHAPATSASTATARNTRSPTNVISGQVSHHRRSRTTHNRALGPNDVQTAMVGNGARQVAPDPPSVAGGNVGASHHDRRPPWTSG
jgi:hypothetical protein